MNHSTPLNSIPSPARSAVRFLSDSLSLNHSLRRLTVARRAPRWSAFAPLRGLASFLGRGVRNSPPDASMH